MGLQTNGRACALSMARESASEWARAWGSQRGGASGSASGSALALASGSALAPATARMTARATARGWATETYRVANPLTAFIVIPELLQGETKWAFAYGSGVGSGVGSSVGLGDGSSVGLGVGYSVGTCCERRLRTDGPRPHPRCGTEWAPGPAVGRDRRSPGADVGTG